MPASPTPDYGLDAPGAVRNLFIIGGVALFTFLTIALGFWTGVLMLGAFHFNLRPMSVGLSVGCLGMAAWMAWDSKYGKVRERERLLDLITLTTGANGGWTGRERVLDVGCGRGLLLIGAAKRLKAAAGEPEAIGRAVGIDLWQQEDLSDNRPEATLENARLEGVADRVEVHTADMRKIPFPDGSFDAVLSMNAIHNIYTRPGRAEAIAEICRVLKPGGTVLIVDIRHIRQYAAALKKGGCTNIRNVGSNIGTLVLTVISLGRAQLGTLIARKDAEPVPARV